MQLSTLALIFLLERRENKLAALIITSPVRSKMNDIVGNFTFYACTANYETQRDMLWCNIACVTVDASIFRFNIKSSTQ